MVTRSARTTNSNNKAKSEQIVVLYLIYLGCFFTEVLDLKTGGQQ